MSGDRPVKMSGERPVKMSDDSAAALDDGHRGVTGSRPGVGARGRWRRIFSEVLTVAVAVLFLMAARSALADHYYVPTASMEYSLLPGDRVLVDKTAYGLRVPFTDMEVVEGRSPRRGDIVVLDSPEDGTRLIKRVVAVGGDRVQLRGGLLTVNGRRLADPARPGIELFGERHATLNLEDGGGPDIVDLQVPSGKLLVVGDHRGNSRDGRVFGLVDEDAVYGRAIGVYYRRADGITWEPL